MPAKKQYGNEKGFTLVELLVAMVIAAIVMSAIYSVYASQQRSYMTQEQVAAMHQNVRSDTDSLSKPGDVGEKDDEGK